MNLIKVDSDCSFSRDKSNGAIVNTNVQEFNTVMQRKKAREEYISSLNSKLAETQDRICQLESLVKSLIEKNQNGTNNSDAQ